MSGYVENVRWTVEERAWKQELPHLSDDVIALLAPPVIVTATSWTEPPREPAPVVRLLAPAAPRNRRRTPSRYVPRNAARTA
jgi:hypothetical protein